MSLTDYIARDIEQRIVRGDMGDDHLKLTELVKRYKVSFTPIRRALEVLIERELVVKQENGRVTVCSDLPSGKLLDEVLNSVPVKRPRSAMDWDQVIQKELIRLSLRGKSEFLREETTAAKYGIGRTALRQVFLRLSGRGWLTHVARRGWQVRSFEESDLEDYLVVREVLECKAIDLAAKSVDPAKLRTMLEGNRASADRSPKLDNRLHGYFIEKAQNRYISEFFERNSEYYNAVFNLAAPETEAVSEMAEQHREILSSAIKKNWLAAKRAMAVHIRAQQPIVLSLIGKMRG
jgi:DNA-binding GntR family transcriptional regulator